MLAFAHRNPSSIVRHVLAAPPAIVLQRGARAQTAPRDMPADRE
jgi:hypothetical protein